MKGADDNKIIIPMSKFRALRMPDTLDVKQKHVVDRQALEFPVADNSPV